MMGRKNPNGYTTKHYLHATWTNMMSRCYRESAEDFTNYGGRGISVTPEWHSFGAFALAVISGIGDRPDGMTFGRVDNDVGYQPGNVRWESRFRQMSNMRRNITYCHEGVSLTQIQWARLWQPENPRAMEQRMINRRKAGKTFAEIVAELSANPVPVNYPTRERGGNIDNERYQRVAHDSK